MIERFDESEFFGTLRGRLDERTSRLVAAAAARAGGRGAVGKVVRASGLSGVTVWRGYADLSGPPPAVRKDGTIRTRRVGGGRKPVAGGDMKAELREIVEPHVRGNPVGPLTWVSKSLRKLASALSEKGRRVCHVTVGKMLLELGFTLQSNKKSHEGGSSPYRDAQFRFINATAAHFLSHGLPAISVDAKKKELVGNFKNPGRDYRPKGKPDEVEVYDFVTEQGRATPYGVYDIACNEGYVNVGISHDTAEFAVDSIRKWWRACGRKRYAGADRLLIMADGGGSNGSRNRLWKAELQKLSDELGIEIYVCHFPPGTSKWNKIEHRLFSHISMNWRGRPLTSLQVIVSLIGSTTSRTGLKVVASSTRKSYKTGVRIADKALRGLNMCSQVAEGPEPMRRWNYLFRPQVKKA